MRNRIYIILSSLIIISCNHRQVKHQITNDRQILVNYLKNDFKISPDPKEFDSLYLAQLKKEGKSLQVDSLISSHLTIARYEQFDLDFVNYYPRYYYKNNNTVDRFSINFIRNYKTGRIYFDFVDWTAGYIFADYCGYFGIDMTQAKGISKKDIKAYASIKSSRRFEQWESYPVEKRLGIESFLNEEFRFKRIGKQELDRLFSFYDSKVYDRLYSDTLMTGPDDLIDYLTSQSNNIKSRYHTTEDLVYLKDQINLLIARNSKCDSVNYLQWIHKNNQRLHERMISIKGSEKSFFKYTVDEKTLCF